jgi:hypothetical protein
LIIKNYKDIAAASAFLAKNKCSKSAILIVSCMISRKLAIIGEQIILLDNYNNKFIIDGVIVPLRTQLINGREKETCGEMTGNDNVNLA